MREQTKVGGAQRTEKRVVPIYTGRRTNTNTLLFFPLNGGKRERERDDSFRALCGLARRQQQLALHARGVLMLLSVSFEEKKTQWSNSALR